MPAHDDASTPARVDLLPFVDALDTREATVASSDAYCAGRGHTVWYSFTPTENVRVAVNTFGSNYDTTLSAYVVDSAGTAQMACNDDTGSLQSRLGLDLVAGVTYQFMVGSYGGYAGGDLVFMIEIFSPAAEFEFTATAALRDSGLVTLVGTATCTRPASVWLSGDVVQAAHRGQGAVTARRDPVWARFTTEGEACGSKTWRINPSAMVGTLARGAAVVTATVTVCEQYFCDEYRIADHLTIERAHRTERYSQHERGRGRAQRAVVRPKR